MIIIVEKCMGNSMRELSLTNASKSSVGEMMIRTSASGHQFCKAFALTSSGDNYTVRQWPGFICVELC